ncbi:FAD-dependent monooxygenase [Phaeobacter sp. C3_T13_0]|uniref:FAD-dependent monooxygenase n=1 Tax=Phaeobacter cretensis TaxID=3342641 RepID=UPI0039BD049A
MNWETILIVGGGIGGLTAAIAMRRQGFAVDIIERDPDWSVYGVGITQQMNVIRAMNDIGVLDDYLTMATGYDSTTIFVGPEGIEKTKFETPKLAGPNYPSNAGIRRPHLQKVLGDKALSLGTNVRLGLTVTALNDDGAGVDVTFSDGSSARYGAVVGADGVFSQMRETLFPDAPQPRYTGQWVWRYNLPRPADLDGMKVFAGPCNAGLVPMTDELMYIFLVTEEPDGMFLEQEGSAAAMRARASKMPPPQLIPWIAQIKDDSEVVARPLKVVYLQDQDWHKGRVVLLGDAVHTTTPHLAQGAGIAIEDALVLAQEMACSDAPEIAFKAYRDRRLERVDHITLNSIRIGEAQMGIGEPADIETLNAQTIQLMSQPI